MYNIFCVILDWSAANCAAPIQIYRPVINSPRKKSKRSKQSFAIQKYTSGNHRTSSVILLSLNMNHFTTFNPFAVLSFHCLFIHICICIYIIYNVILLFSTILFRTPVYSDKGHWSCQANFNTF